MANSITTYYLFKRPVNPQGAIIYGPTDKNGPQATTEGTGEGRGNFYRITEGDPWVLIARANSISSILSTARIIGGQIGLNNVMITKVIDKTQEIRLS